MYYLSAQPDLYYFLWQLELQIFNLKKIGIKADKIHILISFDPTYGLNHYFKEFINKYSDNATFFTYPDNRTNKGYEVTIRPHIIKQHLKVNPKYQNETLFYHDSDVIFRVPIDFDNIDDYSSDKDVWYASDTAYYLNVEYILTQADEELLEEMCIAVGIDKQVVLKNNNQVGGAQYIMKNTTFDFWDKVENDCNKMYSVLKNYVNKKAEILYIKDDLKRSTYNGIESWCAEMWVMLWNCWLHKKTVIVKKELEFCWPTDRVQRWYDTNMLHYSGLTPKSNYSIFRKANYIHHSPFYDQNLKKIDLNTCSIHIVYLIKEYIQQNNLLRYDLRDVTFLIPIRIDFQSRLENLKMVLLYLNKFFITNIEVVEADENQKIDYESISAYCNFSFIPDSNKLFHRTKYNNFLIKKSHTSTISLYDADVIIPVSQIIASANLIRQEKAKMVYPYDGEFVFVDSLYKAMFSKFLDSDLLNLNKKKFISNFKNSVGGCVFLNRKTYITAGMENEFFNSWGVEDLERKKRMRILNNITKRVDGPLYHLPHERGVNSTFAFNTKQTFLEEYFKICNMNKKNLTEYIKSWTWVR